MGSPFLDDVPVDDIAVSQLPYFFFVFLTLLLRSNYIFLILFLCYVSIYTLIFINIIRTNKFSMPGWVGILLFFLVSIVTLFLLLVYPTWFLVSL